MILKAPSQNVMNKIARSVLALYSYDDQAEVMTLENELRQAISLVARTPMIVAHAYAAKRCYFDHDSLYLHRSQDGLSLAENFLYAVRKDNQFTPSEAKLLDLCLVLHAEHGGGNNSAFTCRVISSSHTDFYLLHRGGGGLPEGPPSRRRQHQGQTDAGRDPGKREGLEGRRRGVRRALPDRPQGAGGRLRADLRHGPRHLHHERPPGGDPEEICPGAGPGEGHDRSAGPDRVGGAALPGVFARETGHDKMLCANVDLYSGFVYQMLGIPEELFTPLFATARMVGWCAHRLEEVYTPGNKIIRPAYKAVGPKKALCPALPAGLSPARPRGTVPLRRRSQRDAAAGLPPWNNPKPPAAPFRRRGRFSRSAPRRSSC